MSHGPSCNYAVLRLEMTARFIEFSDLRIYSLISLKAIESCREKKAK